MKIIYVVIFSVITCLCVFSDDLSGNMFCRWGEDPTSYEFDSNKVIGWHYEWGGSEGDIEGNYKIQEIDKIPFLTVGENNLKVVFLHDRYFAWIISMENITQNTILVSPYVAEINNNSLDSKEGIFWIYTSYAISASSSLIEGKTKYLPENLLTKEYSYDGDRIPPYELPWVEGVNGSGINEKLILDFSKPYDNKVNGLIVSNGFVSAKKPDLFLKNNRIKRIKIKSANPPFEMEYTLVDTPNPQYIRFSDYTSLVEITILDVYRGTKYDDTCVNFIFGINGLK